MIIGGLQKFSLIDYPGKLSAIIFTRGCNFLCPYCHNPELVNPQLFMPPIPEEEIFAFLQKRREKLDAVEITGGEPTIQADLVEFIGKIKKLGYLVKLDSNGSSPEMLKKLIDFKIVDCLAMDIKAPLERYEEVVRTRIDTDKIKESIGIIMRSGCDYELRTTIVKSMLDKEDICKIGKMIKGAGLYVLQRFSPAKALDEKFLGEHSYADAQLVEMKKVLENYVSRCIIR